MSFSAAVAAARAVETSIQPPERPKAKKKRKRNESKKESKAKPTAKVKQQKIEPPTDASLQAAHEKIMAITKGREWNAVIKSNYLIPKPLSPGEDWAAHKKALSLYEKDNFMKKKMRYGRAQKPKYVVWKETPTHFVVPTQYGLEHFGPAKTDERYSGDKIDVNYIGPALYDVGQGNYDQMPLFTQLMNHIKRSGRGGIIVSATGSGKTAIDWKLVAELKVKTAIVLPSKTLYQQGPISLAKYLDTKRIGFIRGKKFDIDNKDVVFVMLKTLAQRDFPPDAFKSFSIVLFDELHKAASALLHRALLKVTRVPYIIGQTATLNRSDGMEALFPLVIGPIVCVGSSETRGAKYVDALEVKYYAGKQEIKTRYNSALGHDTRAVLEMMDLLAYDENRNRLLLFIISRCLAANRTVLLFTKTVEHGEILFKACKAAYPEKIIVHATQHTKEEDREKIFKNRHDVIFSTRGLFGYGTDLWYLDTTIEGSPVKNDIDVDQDAGRLRAPRDGILPNGNRQIFLYLADMFPPFSDWWTTVRKICERKGFTILPSEEIRSNRFEDRVWNKLSTALPDTVLHSALTMNGN